MNTAVTHFKMNESKEALVLYREYYDLKLAQVGLRHPETLAALQNLAICHERLKDYDLAMSQYEECLQIRTEVLGSFHPETKSSEKAIEKLKKKIMRRKQLVSTSSFHEDDVDSVPVVVSQEKSETQS
jgi:tetratricopeptide (TPR) repeat protein